MKKYFLENNRVRITGVINSRFKFSHRLYGEKFYTFTLKSRRLSGAYDNIPIMISERLIDVKRNYIGRHVDIIGQFRSRNKWEKSKSSLILYVFVKGIEFCERQEVDTNVIDIDGFLCREPVYRETPMGREITDLMIAINRTYGSDYIPSIAWYRNARFSSNLKIGDRIKARGRIQSRNYNKRYKDGTIEEKETYEISITIIK